MNEYNQSAKRNSITSLSINTEKAKVINNKTKNSNESINFPMSPVSEVINMHPMQRLQLKASQLSGITLEKAFEIDDRKLVDSMGEYYMAVIADNFICKIYESKENNWFMNHIKLSQNELIQNFSEYILQRFGGPNYYKVKKGIPNLIQIHCNMNITSKMAEKWLYYMSDTLDDLLDVIDDAERDILMNYFRHTAYLLVAASNEQNSYSSFRTEDSSTFY